jgi:energy-coupling factor transport system substrate-specific component
LLLVQQGFYDLDTRQSVPVVYLPSKTRVLAFVAAFSAANVALRIALASGPPNIKPTVFLVIVGGIVGGAIPGLLIGWLSVIASDLYFGAGIWTPVTSTCMGIVGLAAGILWHRAHGLSRSSLAFGGFVLTAFFDIGTSIAFALLFNYPWWTSILNLYVPFISGAPTPYPFGFADELTTAALLSIIGPSLITQIRRFYQ